jgi:hypothetical protein
MFQIEPMTFLSSLKSMKIRLFDEDRHRMIGYHKPDDDDLALIDPDVKPQLSPPLQATDRTPRIVLGLGLIALVLLGAAFRDYVQDDVFITTSMRAISPMASGLFSIRARRCRGRPRRCGR